MDFTLLILIITLLMGIMGWYSSVFFNAIWWFCDWREGTSTNWGWDVGLTLGVPFIWIFVIVELFLIYLT